MLKKVVIFGISKMEDENSLYVDLSVSHYWVVHRSGFVRAIITNKKGGYNPLSFTLQNLPHNKSLFRPLFEVSL